MYEVLGRRVRPLALFLSLITLVRVGSFWFDPGLREVTTVLPTHVALVVALASVVLIWLGYWCRQDDWVMVGLFLTAGVMVTFGLLILTLAGVSESCGWVSLLLAGLAAAAGFLEMPDKRDDR